MPQALACFSEGESYEDVIRNCISIGGDSDTLAAIAGGIAEAYYGVPEAYEKKAREFLDPRLLKILDDFEEWLERTGRVTWPERPVKRAVPCVVPQILHDMTDEEFFALDKDDWSCYDEDEIRRWYADSYGRPIVHVYDYQKKPGYWEGWAAYCYRAACRDNPIALAKYAYFCEHGIGCEEDLNTAIACYRRGAELGEIHCLRALERLDRQG